MDYCANANHPAPPRFAEPGADIQTTSSIRRKPRVTYKSPSGGDLYTPEPFLPTTIVQKLAATSFTDESSSPKAPGISFPTTGMYTMSRRKKYSMGPPLPLYHPLGRLALSLPPLDPASIGLASPARSDDAVRRSSARARRPAAKLRDVEEETPAAPTIMAAAAGRESKDKASPRKRRTGGGGGAKRKRKEVDDGDATYPAKRTRLPRGGGNQGGDEESPTESGMPAAEVTPTPEPVAEAAEDKPPERRSTRSRKRRDSSVSEGTSVTASGGATGLGNEIGREGEVMKGNRKSDEGGSPDEEKEEGELSEADGR